MTSRMPLSILLDDDTLVRELWTYVYSAKKIPFTSFGSVDEFQAALPRFAKTDFYYIDQDLNHELSGTDIARNLIERGYENIYLASGHEAEGLPTVAGLKGYVGKSPPVQ